MEVKAGIQSNLSSGHEAPKLDWSVRRIHKIKEINAGISYLEIGVETGSTILNVDMPRKDGVDPLFKFDTDLFASSDVRFFSQTSDAFWTSGKSRTYDIIMIDGLHTFEQTFRDLLCSMRFSHQQTVWLIDDTLPSDVFSAIPDQARCLRERQKLGSRNRAWHGDVYKIVPAIHDFIPVFDYATIVKSGNPQTLAWFSNRNDFKPRLANLEAISRMNYFDIEPNLGLFNIADEDEAFSRLRTTFGEALRVLREV
ncbi:MAG TPA: class I SAM-dependent methyltransferase [Aestuariivirga sp.]|nr:class I SAM-dependent methyltransferase [Aestuariivirga sp.]